VFDLSITKILVLAVIALIVFGPNELPKVASQAGRMLRDLRRIAEGAKADLRDGLGPEFQDFDFQDLNPKTFVRKHLFDEAEQQALFDQFKATTDISTEPVTATATGHRPAERQWQRQRRQDRDQGRRRAAVRLRGHLTLRHLTLRHRTVPDGLA
jgi:sec-independent protein translocase protein TatB